MWPEPARMVGPFGAVLVALFLYWIAAFALGLNSFVHTPFSDMHDWLLRLFEAQREHHWLSYLWASHGEQRIVLARVFTWWDVAAGQRGVSSFLVSCMLIQLAVALSSSALTFVSLPPSPWRTWAAGLVGLALLNIPFVDDASFANASVYIYAAGFAALAITAFAARGRTGWRRAMLPLAIVFAILAGFGNSAGLVVWPVLVIGAFRARAERPALLACLIVGLIVIVLSLAGLGAPVGDLPASTDAAYRPMKMVSYFLGYIALPWASEPRLALRVGGALLTGAYVWLLWRGPDADDRGPLCRAGLDLMAFAMITGALAAVGRSDALSAPIVPIRYAVFAMAGHAGLLMVLAPRLCRLAGQRPRWAAGAIAIVMLSVVINQAEGARRLLKSVAHVRAASIAFDHGDRSSAVVGLVSPADPARTAAIREGLRRRGLPW